MRTIPVNSQTAVVPDWGRSRRLAPLLLWLAVASGCGADEDASDKDEALGLPSTQDADSGGFTFGTDDADGATDPTGADVADPAEAKGESDASADPDTDPDARPAPDTAAGDTGAADAGPPPPIVDCAGSCGLFLEDNACHCHHGCLGSSDACCGGDGGYLGACACQASADCDDGDPCTTDSCQQKGAQKLCMNLPFAGCCTSDAACAGGDGVCAFAKCIDGTCSIQPKPCDDGVDCTIDSCDPKGGACQHKLSASSCHIDGGCWKAGDAKPGTGGCQRCKPDVEPKAWSPEPNKCFIDGECIAAGAKASAADQECRTCQPQSSKDAWTILSGQCHIDGACIATGSSGQAGSCQVCDAAQSQTAWSGKPGTCAVDGACYDKGAVSPAGACATCQPEKSTSAFTVAADTCLIAGACVAKGASKPNSGGCEVCDPATPTQWKANIGKACDDSNNCTKEDACTSQLVCQGKATTAFCCKADAECATQVQPGPCQKAVCKGDGTCAIAPNPLCCSKGVCCDVGAQEMLPKGTLCYSDSKSVEYKCEDNQGHVRKVGYGCTGDHESKCSSSVKGYGPWEAMSNVLCEVGKTCHTTGVSSPVCK